jgi:hypothetical protein
LDSQAEKLRDAFTAAIREEVGEDPVDRRQLVTLHASFRKTLENAASPDSTVTDMNYRAQLAAAFDAAYQRIYAASRVP